MFCGTPCSSKNGRVRDFQRSAFKIKAKMCLHIKRYIWFWWQDFFMFHHISFIKNKLRTCSVIQFLWPPFSAHCALLAHTLHQILLCGIYFGVDKIETNKSEWKMTSWHWLARVFVSSRSWVLSIWDSWSCVIFWIMVGLSLALVFFWKELIVSVRVSI